MELRYPPYNSDLAPSDFVSFKNIKKFHFTDLLMFFFDGVTQLKKHWEKCHQNLFIFQEGMPFYL